MSTPTGIERTDGLMRMAIAGLSDADIAAYRDAIRKHLPDSQPETIRQLGRALAMLDEEVSLRSREP